MCNEKLNVRPAAVVPNFTAVGFGVQAKESKEIVSHLVDLSHHETVFIQGCLGASYNADSHQICVSLPIVGNVCVPSPVNLPIGVQIQACYQTCTTWGIPTGVQVSFRVNGAVILSQNFGRGC